MGPIRVFAGTIASGASSCEIDTGGDAFTKVFVQLPTMSTAVVFDVYGSHDGSAYAQVFERVNTAPVQYQSLIVAAGVGTNGGIAPLDVTSRYVQLRGSAVVSGGVAVKLITWNS